MLSFDAKNTMRSTRFTYLLSFLFLWLNFSLPAQSPYTPYDDGPGLIKSYKPAYQEDYPDWAKMLYDYPVNYRALVNAYEHGNRDKSRFAPIIRYYKLWQRKIAQYADENGIIHLPSLSDYYLRLKKNQLAAKATAELKTESNWTFLGPKQTFWLNESGEAQVPAACPWQVNIYSFDVFNPNPDILYCGTETGFVNKTLDGGMTWNLLAANYHFGGGVTAVAIHPSNSDIIYVSAGSQIHKTMDGGTTWTPMLDVGDLFRADRLVIDPDNPSKILAATDTGVFISSDAGQTWMHPWAAPTWDIQIKWEDSSRIFALTKSGDNFAMVESIDGGLSFAEQANFPNTISEGSGGLLAATPADPNILVAILLSANNTPFLYKETLDTGVWNLLATGQSTAFPMDNGQGFFDLALGMSPTDANVIFVGASTLYKSVDGGQNFTAIGGYHGDFPIHPDIQDIKVLPNDSVWVATDGGMTFSTDYFTQTENAFARIKGIVGSDMWGFDQGWNEDLVVGGRYHNGNTAMAEFYQSKALRMGGAESPTGWVLQGKSRHVAFNDLGNGWVLPEYAEGNPQGRFIFSQYPNMDEYGGRRSNLVFHPNYYGTVYLGEGNALWKSTDMGVTYDLIHNFNFRVRFLQISQSNPDVLYADIVNRGLFKSTDGGETWEAKPALFSNAGVDDYWKGKLFFTLSPTNADVIYVCLQNGTWSSDIGKVFKSMDGGDSWQDWTGSLSVYTKNLVIQPDQNGHDILYLFSNGANGASAGVYKRGDGMDDWADFGNGFPAGFWVNAALPFYRDSKIRVAGTAGVWQSPMAEENFRPIINPWVKSSYSNCMFDTLFFDDHSILNHEGVSWHWSFSPEPAYISDADSRNPQVVLESPDSYDVSLSVTKNGITYDKTIANMVTTTTCPSIEDCNNPASVPKDIWSLLYVDSEEVGYPGLATMAFDDDPSTIWHTRWSTGSDPYPHEIQIDMGAHYQVSVFEYLARSNGPNGRIKDYELYFSDDGENWYTPVQVGQFVNTAAPQKVEFNPPVEGRYFRLVALSEVNDNAWTSAAEFNVVGCRAVVGVEDHFDAYANIKAFPVPTSGRVEISLAPAETYQYTFWSANGQLLDQGQLTHGSFDLSNYPDGIYLIRLKDGKGRVFRVKVVKGH